MAEAPATKTEAPGEKKVAAKKKGDGKKKVPNQVKRNRQALLARARNRSARSLLKTVIEKAFEAKDADRAQAVKTALKAVSKAGSAGVLHRNTVSRRMSRLMRHEARKAKAKA